MARGGRTAGAMALRRYVDKYQQLTGMKQKDIATRCNYSASMFSHLKTGTKPLANKTAVLAIGRGLELDPDELNDLLQQAGFEPLTDDEAKLYVPAQRLLGWQQAQAAVDPVRPPERDALADVVQDEIGLVASAWQYYGHVMDSLYRREWKSVASEFDGAVDQYYWPMRQAAARLLAHLYLAKSAALQGNQSLDEAERACQEGLTAANLAGDLMSRCVLNARLADIEKLTGRFDAAALHYREALKELPAWPHPTPVQREWRDHWQARIHRKQGSLALFQGAPAESLRALKVSAEHFERSGPPYELSQLYHAMGWAHSLRGDWDSALTCHTEAMAITQRINQGNESKDRRSFLQGYLYLAGVAIDRGELDAAEAYLDKAEAVSKQVTDAYFHDLGRVHLLRGRVFLRRRRWAEAERFTERGIEFYKRKSDPVRLASGYNIQGGIYLYRDAEGDAHRALRAFDEAARLARRTTPTSQHYETATNVLRCQALLKTEETATGLHAALKATEVLCRSGIVHNVAAGGYWQHLARLKLVELEAYRRTGDDLGMTVATQEALRAACQYNRFLVNEVAARLLNLHLPERTHRDLLATARETIRESLTTEGRLATYDALLRETVKIVEGALTAKSEELAEAVRRS